MPAVQTSYSERHGKATAGLIGSMVTYDAISRSCDTANGIPFGRAVCRDTGDPVNKAVLGGALATFLGVSIRDITVVPLDGGTVDRYPLNHNMGILTQGEIWVVAVEAVTAGNAVYYDLTTGEFGDTAGSGIEGPVVGAQWRDSASQGELARVKFGIAK